MEVIDENNEEFKVQTFEGQKKLLAYWIVSVLFADQCIFPVAIFFYCEINCNTHFLKQICVIKDGHLLITEQHRGFPHFISLTCPSVYSSIRAW